MGLFVYGTRAGLAQSKPLLKCVQCGHHVLKTNWLAVLTHLYVATLVTDVVFLLVLPQPIAWDLPRVCAAPKVKGPKIPYYRIPFLIHDKLMHREKVI